MKSDTTPKEKKRLSQIILRIDNEDGHHIIRYNETGWPYTVEGYRQKPDNYLAAPEYFLPIPKEEVQAEFAKQGKEWRYG
jgi:hypothetical protein